MVETYIQELRPDKEMGQVPAGDHYFLGRGNLQGLRARSQFPGQPTAKQSDRFAHVSSARCPGRLADFIPVGFAQMAVIDSHGL